MSQPKSYTGSFGPIPGEYVYQISALCQVYQYQKIDFGEVVVIGYLVKIGPKYEKVTKIVHFSQAMMPMAWFGVECLIDTLLSNIRAFHPLQGSINKTNNLNNNHFLLTLYYVVPCKTNVVMVTSYKHSWQHKNMPYQRDFLFLF